MPDSRPSPHGSSTLAVRRRPDRGRWRDARGFTILEVVMATLVMAFGIATSIIVIQSGYKDLDVARDTTLASQIMQSEIERIRLMSWSAVSALPASEDVSLATMFSSSADLARKFTVTRTVTTDASRSTVRNITVSVTWRGYDGRSHTRSFTTMYAQNGLYDFYYTLANS